MLENDIQDDEKGEIRDISMQKKESKKIFEEEQETNKNMEEIQEQDGEGEIDHISHEKADKSALQKSVNFDDKEDLNVEADNENDKQAILNISQASKQRQKPNKASQQLEKSDFAIDDDIDEIKEEKLNISHNTSKKKDQIIPSIRALGNDDNFEDINLNYANDTKKTEHSKKLNSKKSENSRNNNINKNIINNTESGSNTNNSNNEKGYSSNYANGSKNNNNSNKDETAVKKHNNRPLYEGSDISKHEKLNTSVSKLINIPAACEIEEYDFLFIDLEDFINFHTNGFYLSELADFMKKISSGNKKPRIVVNYPNILINLNVINLELLETLMSIMSYTDIFLFEKKESLAFFNMLNQMEYEKELNEKQLIDFFLKEVPHQKASTSKLGLFLEELQSFTISEQKADKIVNNLSYEIKLHPKINHFNQKIIDEYKKIMTINNNYFKSIFFGGYFSSFVFNQDHYISFITGAESTKRILETFKNKIDFPTNPEFYLIRLQKTKILKDLKTQKLKKKEEKFVLDCVNKMNSSIKSYNPLFDENLNAFFASGNIRKQLKEKGFINTNGFVLYDSSYKNVSGSLPKHNKRLDTQERERHLLLAIKHNRVNQLINYIKYLFLFFYF